MEKKEKPLEKLTAKELREMALGIPGIHGVHAMKKEELITAIRAAKGIAEPEHKKEKHAVVKKEKVVLSIAELKQKAKELRAKREELLGQKNWKMSSDFEENQPVKENRKEPPKKTLGVGGAPAR
jgi:hypothetical protein